MHSQIIRERCSIRDYIGKYLELKPRGPGEFLGICPFHHEKTPSFTVSESKNFFHCFGCGEHGDIIAFAMKYHRMDYPEAKKNISETFNIRLPEQNPKVFDLQQQLFSVNQCAIEWYQESLNSPEGRGARQYLERRGIPPSIWQRYKLGYCPGNTSGLSERLRKNFRHDLILKSKVFVERVRHGSGENYLSNPFCRRVIFPIYDAFGNPVGFGGRILEGSGGGDPGGRPLPKYINSAETAVFNKGKVLYGFDHAKQHLADRRINERGSGNSSDSGSKGSEGNSKANSAVPPTNAVYLVEGYLDVLSLAASGFGNAVAPLGTALQKAHIESLWQKKYQPILCLDGDPAGYNATARIINECFADLSPEQQIHAVILDRDQDPNSLLPQLTTSWEEYVTKSKITAAEFLFRHHFNRTNYSIPEERANLRHQLRTLAGRLQHRDLAYEYRQFFENRFWDEVRNARQKMNEPQRSGMVHRNITAATTLPMATKPRHPSDHVITMLAAVLINPAAVDEWLADRINELVIADPELESLRQFAVSQVQEIQEYNPNSWQNAPVSQKLQTTLATQIKSLSQKLELGLELEVPNPLTAEQITKLQRLIHRCLLVEEQSTLTEEIKRRQESIKLELQKQPQNGEKLASLEASIIRIKQRQLDLHRAINQDEQG